jgi:hypothetical protein
VATTALGSSGRQSRNSANLVQVVRVRFAWFASVIRNVNIPHPVRTVERSFVLRVSENAAEDALDVLQGRPGQVIFIGDCLEHSAGIHRSELTQTNVTDTIADVVVPDFRMALSRGRALFLDVLQIEVLDKFRQRYAGFRCEPACIQPSHELCERGLIWDSRG